MNQDVQLYCTHYPKHLTALSTLLAHITCEQCYIICE